MTRNLKCISKTTSLLSLSENANIIFQSSTTENEKIVSIQIFFLYVFNDDNDENDCDVWYNVTCSKWGISFLALLPLSSTSQWKCFQPFLHFFSSFKMNSFLYFIRHFPHVHIFVLPSTTFLHVLDKIISLLPPIMHSQFKDIWIPC